MRLLALLLLTATLSGCAFQVTYDETPTKHSGETYCTVTVNGKTYECDDHIRGPKENITIDLRAPLTEGLDETWTFAVHPNATVASIWFAFEPYDEGGAGAMVDRGCLRLKGPTSGSSGNCGGSLALGVSPVPLTESEVRVDHEGLRTGDYSFSADVPRSAADYHLRLTVTY